MRGDPTLFVREDAVDAAWRVVDAVLEMRRPIHEYDPGTWGPAEADRLTGGLEGWRNPPRKPLELRRRLVVRRRGGLHAVGGISHGTLKELERQVEPQSPSALVVLGQRKREVHEVAPVDPAA